jgi:hypothetical protein
VIVGYVVGWLFAAQLAVKLWFIGMGLLLFIGVGIRSGCDPVPGHGIKDDLAVFGRLSVEVLKYPWGEFSLRDRRPERGSGSEPSNSARAVGRFEFSEPYTLPYDAKVPVLSLTDELVTNQRLQLKYAGPKTFLAGRSEDAVLAEVDAVFAQAKVAQHSHVVLLGHNEEGVYKWRAGTTVQELDHGLVDALARKHGVSVVHFSCNSASFSRLGIVGIQRSHVLADRLLRASQAFSPEEFGSLLGLKEESRIASEWRASGKVRKGIRSVRPLSWLGPLATLYDIYEKSGEIHDMQRSLATDLDVEPLPYRSGSPFSDDVFDPHVKFDVDALMKDDAPKSNQAEYEYYLKRFEDGDPPKPGETRRSGPTTAPDR